MTQDTVTLDRLARWVERADEELVDFEDLLAQYFQQQKIKEWPHVAEEALRVHQSAFDGYPQKDSPIADLYSVTAYAGYQCAFQVIAHALGVPVKVIEYVLEPYETAILSRERLPLSMSPYVLQAEIAKALAMLSEEAEAERIAAEAESEQ